MNSFKELINAKAPKTIVDYFSLDKEISEKWPRLKEEKTARIAIISSFTVKGIKEILNVKCASLGMRAEFYVCEYNRHLEEIFDKDSGFYKFDPVITILFIDSRSLLGRLWDFPYRCNEDERAAEIKRLSGELASMAKFIREHSSSRILLHNLEVPWQSPLGVLESRTSCGFRGILRKINENIESVFAEDSRVFIFDYESFCAKHGKKNIVNPKMFYLADIKVDFAYMVDLCQEYMGFIRACLGLSRKCLVLDLDNTLWGGILGEDGIDAVRLGETPQGRPYLDFQKYILSLYDRGIILAINSNNNYDDVMEVFNRHPNMLLKENHFAALKINWKSKAENLVEIAREISIGLDSILYIDDEVRNRRLIGECLPEVEVFDLPEDASLYHTALAEYNGFNTLEITPEDKARGGMYVQHRRRKEILCACENIEYYLKKLDIRLTFIKADSFCIPRLAQLSERTNQFNMTGARITQDEVRKLCENAGYMVYALKVEDSVGDSGIAGSMIIKKDASGWMIDSFFLSCRVLGRRIEDAAVSFIVDKARAANIAQLSARFVSTPKNLPAKDFYARHGFKKTAESSSGQIWALVTGGYTNGPGGLISVCEREGS